MGAIVMGAIEKAALAAAKATEAGYVAGDYSANDHDGGVMRIHARIACAAVLAFLEEVDIKVLARNIAHETEKPRYANSAQSIAAATLAALRAEAGASE